jgi:hypothetical protein
MNDHESPFYGYCENCDLDVVNGDPNHEVVTRFAASFSHTEVEACRVIRAEA